MSAESPRFTLDTNLLVYSIDNAAGMRHRRAGEIVDCAVDSDCWLTLQALGEFYAAVTRKGFMPPADAAAQVADWFALFPTIPASAAAVRAALADASMGRASYWDALLIATAAEAGCAIVLTEDVSNGSVLHGSTIHNPFAASGELTETARLARLGLAGPGNVL